jgi:hypothetical protein
MPTTLRLKGPVRVSHSVNPDDVATSTTAAASRCTAGWIPAC